MKDDETLLDKAIQNYNFSVNSWKHRLDDEVYLNFIGYFLQQSVELAIKYTLSENSVKYDKTHNIEQLLYIGHKNNIEMNVGEYIEDHAEMFTSWEANTRYVLNYRIESKKIETAINEVGEYLERLQNLELIEELSDEKNQDKEEQGEALQNENTIKVINAEENTIEKPVQPIKQVKPKSPKL